MNFKMYTFDALRSAGWFYDYERNEKTIFNFHKLQEMKYGKSVFGDSNENVYAVASDKNKIVGVLKIKINGCESYRVNGFCNWVNFITVHPSYQNQGISKQLIEMGFKWLSENGFDHILISGYSSKGFFFAKDTFRSVAIKYNLKYQDEDCISFPDQDKDHNNIYDKEKLLAA